MGRSLQRSYRERLTLPTDLDLPGLEVTRSFLHRTLRPNRSILRRTVLNIERVVVETTSHMTLHCTALPEVLAVVEPPDQVEAVRFTIRTRRHSAVSITWRAGGGSVAEVEGSTRVWVAGVKTVLEQFLAEEQFLVAQAQPPVSWQRKKAWLDNIAVEVAGGLALTAVLALLAAAWAALT